MVVWPSGASIQDGWSQGHTQVFGPVSVFTPPPASGQGAWYLLTVAPIVW